MPSFAHCHCLLVVASLLLFGPGTFGAQSGTSTLIAGIADAETGQPLVGAEVLLVKLHRLSRANALGEATVTEIPRGVQRVRVRRLGYAPAEVDVAIARDTTGAVFRLHRIATTLGEVKVQAEWIHVYLDDIELGNEYGDWVRTWDLAAIEFYTGPQVPVRYRTRSYGCGVFLLWSKWY